MCVHRSISDTEEKLCAHRNCSLLNEKKKKNRTRSLIPSTSNITSSYAGRELRRILKLEITELFVEVVSERGQ